MTTKTFSPLKYVVRFIDGATLVLRKLSVLAGEVGKLFKVISKAIPNITLVVLLILSSTGQIGAILATKVVGVSQVVG